MIRFFYYIIRVQRLCKARPAGSGFEFMRGTEQWLPGNDIYINPFFFIVPVCIVKWLLRTVFLGYIVLERGSIYVSERLRMVWCIGCLRIY